MLRRTKTIVFNDDPDTAIYGEPEPSPSARRPFESVRATLRKVPPAVPASDSEAFEPAPAPNAVHERMNFLRSEFENEPISRGSQESLAALREEFRRKHVTSEDAPGPAFALPSLGGFKASRLILVAVALIAVLEPVLPWLKSRLAPASGPGGGPT